MRWFFVPRRIGEFALFSFVIDYMLGLAQANIELTQIDRGEKIGIE